MPQVQLPVFPPGTTAITAELGFERKEKQVVYLNGHLPVFTHQVDDLGSFRFFTSQLIANGTASHGQIAEAFGVPLVTVKRYYRRFREQAGAFQPFFVVTQAVDPGLRKVLEEQIAPRLLQEVPGQPTEVELAANCYLRRFSMIFDREGFSPEMFKRLWELRIAVITYRKFAKDLWDPEEFVLRKVRLVNGEEVEMELAERGVRLSNGLWVREIRRQDPETGHQTAIITTDYLRDLTGIAAAMFARWCQENFFQYMAEHFGLDRLIEYGTEPPPDTILVVNPAWRRKDQEVRRTRALLVREQARFGALSCPTQAEPEAMAAFEEEKGKLLEQIEQRQESLAQLKAERKAIDRQLTIKDLPKEDRFTQLRTAKKHSVDTIKLIAYRAETALVHIVRESLHRLDDARALVRQVFNSTVDRCPDQKKTKFSPSGCTP